MSKKIIVLCLVLLSILDYSYSQKKELVIKNKITGKERIISESQRIKIAYNNRKVIRGELILNSTAGRSLENNEFTISKHPDLNNNIESIYKVNQITAIKVKSLAGDITGVTITIFGVAMGVVGIALLNNPPGGDMFSSSTFSGFVTGGLFITVVGILVVTLHGKIYQSDDWEFSIRTK